MDETEFNADCFWSFPDYIHFHPLYSFSNYIITKRHIHNHLLKFYFQQCNSSTSQDRKNILNFKQASSFRHLTKLKVPVLTHLFLICKGCVYIYIHAIQRHTTLDQHNFLCRTLYICPTTCFSYVLLNVFMSYHVFGGW